MSGWQIRRCSAVGLTALIGLKREIQGKRAGLGMQTIVGTAAALTERIDPDARPLRGGPRSDAPAVCDGIERVADWLALVKLAVEPLEGTAADLDQLRVLHPPGLAIVLRGTTSRHSCVII